MKILASLVLAGSLLVSQPLSAEIGNLLERVPESVLMQGMNDITVCIRGNRVAAGKLREMLTELQAQPDEGENHKSINDVAARIEALSKITEVEVMMGSAMAKTLINHYSHTVEKLGEDMKDVVAAANETMQEALKDVGDIPAFDNAFTPHLRACSTIVVKLGEKVKFYTSSLEVQK